MICGANSRRHSVSKLWAPRRRGIPARCGFANESTFVYRLAERPRCCGHGRGRRRCFGMRAAFSTVAPPPLTIPVRALENPLPLARLAQTRCGGRRPGRRPCFRPLVTARASPTSLPTPGGSREVLLSLILPASTLMRCCGRHQGKRPCFRTWAARASPTPLPSTPSGRAWAVPLPRDHPAASTRFGHNARPRYLTPGVIWITTSAGKMCLRNGVNRSRWRQL